MASTMNRSWWNATTASAPTDPGDALGQDLVQALRAVSDSVNRARGREDFGRIQKALANLGRAAAARDGRRTIASTGPRRPCR